uniref:Putative secreted protein n=1 Tax=Ixodes ricinus TaxID=34613 RepID=A0A6B0U4X7_IXORI
MQWTGRKPAVLALRLGVTATFTAWAVTTWSVKSSWVKTAFILARLLGRMGIFMPRVEQTRSAIGLSWLPWKWMAISSSISPNEAFTPLVLPK